MEKAVERLREDKDDEKVFYTKENEEFIIKSLKFSIIIPSDLSDDMFNKVKASKSTNEWQKFKVDSKHSRGYDFYFDVSEVRHGEFHLVDIV